LCEDAVEQALEAGDDLQIVEVPAPQVLGQANAVGIDRRDRQRQRDVLGGGVGVGDRQPVGVRRALAGPRLEFVPGDGQAGELQARGARRARRLVEALACRLRDVDPQQAIAARDGRGVGAASVRGISVEAWGAAGSPQAGVASRNTSGMRTAFSAKGRMQ